MFWPFLIALLVAALVVADRVARANPTKLRARQYRRATARLLSRLFRNEVGQAFLVPALRENFGPRCTIDNDISDHLSELFFEVMNAEPRLIVELGTRGGESTRVLLSAAQLLNARVLSVDIAECAHIDLPPASAARWTFVRADDVAFGKEGFAKWCAAEGLPPVADLIFLDTSHLYDHTVAELQAWMPLLRVGGLIIFHDTNMRAWMYRRMDNSRGVGAYNDRGVIRAIEEYVGRTYDETSVFCDITEQFVIKHKPTCNGFTIMKKRVLGATAE